MVRCGMETECACVCKRGDKVDRWGDTMLVFRCRSIYSQGHAAFKTHIQTNKYIHLYICTYIHMRVGVGTYVGS